MNKLLKDLSDCFYIPLEHSVPKQEVEECRQALINVPDKPERRLVTQIIDAKDRIAEETSIDSSISGFALEWRRSAERNQYEKERAVSRCTAKRSGALSMSGNGLFSHSFNLQKRGKIILPGIESFMRNSRFCTRRGSFFLS